MTGPAVAVRDVFNMPDQAQAWWDRVLERAHAVVILQGGTRLFVTEAFEDLVAHPPTRAFVAVHMVSAAHPENPIEFTREVHDPALLRAYPLALVRSIGPLPDAETTFTSAPGAIGGEHVRH